MNEFEKILNHVPNTPVRVFVTRDGIGFNWSYKGIGFGEIFIGMVDGVSEDPNMLPTGRLALHTEAESKEFVKKVICQAIDEGTILS